MNFIHNKKFTNITQHLIKKFSERISMNVLTLYEKMKLERCKFKSISTHNHRFDKNI